MERAFIERKKSIDHKSKTYLTWCRIKVVQTMIPGELGDMIKQQIKGEGSNVLIGIYKEQSFSTKNQMGRKA